MVSQGRPGALDDREPSWDPIARPALHSYEPSRTPALAFLNLDNAVDPSGLPASVYGSERWGLSQATGSSSFERATKALYGTGFVADD